MIEAEKMAERLDRRIYADDSHGSPVSLSNEPTTMREDIVDAAALIRAQASEIERLREALKPFADAGTWICKGPDANLAVSATDNKHLILLETADFHRARAVLEPNP